MHRVLLFGDRVIGSLGKQDIAHSNATVDLVNYPTPHVGTLGRLTEYSLVFLDYSAFSNGGSTSGSRQDIFDKQISEALSHGTTFCFLYYDEVVPSVDEFNLTNGYMSFEQLSKLTIDQIGLRWLRRCGNFTARRHDVPVTDSEIAQSAFAPYLRKWGASRNYFLAHNSEEVFDRIYFHDKYLFGFACKSKKGRFIFLPCQRDYAHKSDLRSCLTTLIDCSLTYLSKIRQDLPTWAITPFFAEEESLVTQRSQLATAISTVDGELAHFSEAKALLFAVEHDFEIAIERFFSKNLGLSTRKNERYLEDFLIVDEGSNVLAICEAKSTVKGFKKSGVYSIHNHRESNGYPETLPAIVVVNQHMQASDWASKVRPIDKQDFQVATSNNVLVLRTEDVVRLWRLLALGSIDRSGLLKLLTNSQGWLEVTKDLSIQLHS